MLFVIRNFISSGKNAWVQIVETNGDKSYLPLVPVVDSDLTFYDNVNQVLLSGESSSQGVKGRMNEVQPMSIMAEPLNSNVEDDLDEDNDCPVLDPHDVSKCLSDMQSENVKNNSATKLVIHEPEGSQPASSQHDHSALENSINDDLAGDPRDQIIICLQNVICFLIDTKIGKERLCRVKNA